MQQQQHQQYKFNTLHHQQQKYKFTTLEQQQQQQYKYNRLEE
jgi:hypothetical protein